jgi:hypothetical protein
MNFVQATSRLIESITLEDVANEIGVSHGLLRLSRLDPSNPAYRPPPSHWQNAVVRLAKRRSADLERLAEQLAAKANSAVRKAARKKRSTSRSTRRKRSA